MVFLWFSHKWTIFQMASFPFSSSFTSTGLSFGIGAARPMMVPDSAWGTAGDAAADFAALKAKQAMQLVSKEILSRQGLTLKVYMMERYRFV